MRRRHAGETGRDLRIRRFVIRLARAREIVQEQHRVGRGDLLPGALDADPLHLVVALAQARRVDHVQRHALDLDGLLHLVARGAGDRRHDGQLRAGQGVQQRTLARVGLARDHHLDALAQQRALPRAPHHLRQRALQRRQLAMGIRLAQEIDLFLRKIERGLHQHAQVHQRIAQPVDLVGEGTRQRTAGAARGGFGAGVDQVGDRLGLREVDLVVQERALGELAGPRQPQARQARPARGTVRLAGGLQAAGQQQLQHHGAAVRLQLQHVLSGVAVRRGKIQRQPLVDGLPPASRNGR